MYADIFKFDATFVKTRRKFDVTCWCLEKHQKRIDFSPKYQFFKMGNCIGLDAKTLTKNNCYNWITVMSWVSVWCESGYESWGDVAWFDLLKAVNTWVCNAFGNVYCLFQDKVVVRISTRIRCTYLHTTTPPIITFIRIPKLAEPRNFLDNAANATPDGMINPKCM